MNVRTFVRCFTIDMQGGRYYTHILTDEGITHVLCMDMDVDTGTGNAAWWYLCEMKKTQDRKCNVNYDVLNDMAGNDNATCLTCLTRKIE